MFLRVVVALIGSPGDKAGNSGHALGSAQRMDVLVENFVGRRRAGSCRDHVVRLFKKWTAVQRGQAWRCPGRIAAVVTCVAGYVLLMTRVPPRSALFPCPTPVC